QRRERPRQGVPATRSARQARRRGRAPRRQPRAGGRTATGPRRSWRDEVPELVEARRADPGNCVELVDGAERAVLLAVVDDLLRKSTRLNSSHVKISYAVFCLKK